ncbi:MAG: zinc ribbon domain-containing protein [bacterium]
MPLYEYKCKVCNKVSEFLVSSSDDIQGLKCLTCGSKELAKIMSAANIAGSRNDSCDLNPSCCGDNPGCSLANKNGICKNC